MRPITPSSQQVVSRRAEMLRAEGWVRWIAIALMANAGIALVGWATGAPRLTAPIPGFDPMPAVGAAAALCNAIALWAAVAERPKLHLSAALTALAINIIAFALAFSTATSARPVASIAGAALGFSASVALVIATRRTRPGLVQGTHAVAGLILVALSVTVVGARVLGVFGPGTSRVVLGASAQGLAASMLIGGSMLLLVWAEGIAATEPPRWVPLATGLACLLTVVLMWRALDARETETMQAQARSALENERRIIMRDVGSTSRLFMRVANNVGRGTPPADQKRNFFALVADIPGLTSAMIVDTAGNPVIAAPERFDAAGLKAAWRRYVPVGRASPGGDTLSIVPLDPKSERFAIIAPICNAAGCHGAAVGVMDAAALFATSLSGVSSGYQFVIHHDGEVLGINGVHLPPFAMEEDIDVRLGAAHWQLAAWMTAETVRRLRTSLPAAVLFLGLIVSALLPVALRYGETAWHAARVNERARIASALERSTDGMWDLDMVTGKLMRSDSLWRHLGYDPSEAPPDREGWMALMHEHDRHAVEMELAKHVTGETPTYEVEYRLRAKDGTWHVKVDRGRVVERGPGGEPTRLLGVSADVTETRKVQAARDASERRFRATFDSGFQYQLLLDPAGRVLEVNRAALERAQVTASEVVGYPLNEALWWKNPSVDESVLCTNIHAAAAGQTVHYEEEIPEAGGPTMILEVGIKPVADAEGEVSQLLFEARDVTLRRRLDASLQGLDTLAAMGRIAARVAHEINNPLAGIQYSFLLIKDVVPADHPHHASVGAIERAIARIAAVTRQLYETYQPERELSPDASLTTVVGDAVAFLQQANRAKQVKVETDLEGVPGLVPVSAAVLRQIVYNLVQNAMDASPAGGTVRLAARVAHRALTLRVADAGPGVAAELRERVFEPFFSTKDARMNASSMGLGLALVKQTVTSAGGTIRVETADGGGAEFVVVLPLADMGNRT